jgi:hypothetical protein
VRYTLIEAQIAWLADDDARAIAALELGMKVLPELPERTEDTLRGAHHLAGWIRLDAGDLDGAARHLAVLQSLSVGPGMHKVDFARSTRRLDAAIALRRGDAVLASKRLTTPTAGPTEPDSYDAEFERQLDLASWDRIALAGGPRPPSTSEGSTWWRPTADRRVAFAAFVRAIGTPSTTLAAASP